VSIFRKTLLAPSSGSYREDGGNRLYPSTWCSLAHAKVARSIVNDNKRFIYNKGTTNVTLRLESFSVVIEGL